MLYGFDRETYNNRFGNKCRPLHLGPNKPGVESTPVYTNNFESRLHQLQNFFLLFCRPYWVKLNDTLTTCILFNDISADLSFCFISDSSLGSPVTHILMGLFMNVIPQTLTY